MTELKTLKDIDFNYSKDWLENMTVNKHVQQIIRQEAIKWVKACKNCYKENGKLRYGKHVCIGCVRFVRFFDITEEDLK